MFCPAYTSSSHLFEFISTTNLLKAGFLPQQRLTCRARNRYSNTITNHVSIPTSPGRSTANPDKSLVAAAVETVPAPKNRRGKHGHTVERQHGFFAGDTRIAVLPAATGAELGAFPKANVCTPLKLLTRIIHEAAGESGGIGTNP
jgi:hypothetical protein